MLVMPKDEKTAYTCRISQQTTSLLFILIGSIISIIPALLKYVLPLQFNVYNFIYHFLLLFCMYIFIYLICNKCILNFKILETK